MMDVRLPQVNHYAKHLLAWKPFHPVTLTTDLAGKDGELLFSAGTEFDDGMAAQLKQYFPDQLLSEWVNVEGSFDGESLFSALRSFFYDDPVLQELYEKRYHAPLLAKFCERVCADRQLAQHLWILHLSAPRIFERALFGAWFMVALLARLGDEAELYDGFVAGLVHDLGLLYLDPQVLIEGHNSDSDLWRAFIQHPEVGAEVITWFDEVSAPVVRAVKEHHEELDGTGFPQGKLAKQLAPLGRYLQLLDSLHAVYTKYFRPRARTLADVTPIVQMNHLCKPGQPAAELILLLREGMASQSCSVPENLMPLLIGQVRARHFYIKQFVAQADVFLEQNQLAIANARFFALHNLLEHIAMAMKQSGLINDGYIRWLDQVEKEQLVHAYKEVEDVFLMMQEILYHIRRFTLQLRRFSEIEEKERTKLTAIWAPNKTIPLVAPTPAEPSQSMHQSLLGFTGTKEPELPPELESLWLAQVRQLRKR